MTPLVSLEEVRDQVSATQPEDDARLDLLAQIATGICMNYVSLTDPATGTARNWTEATVPDAVKAAILMLVAKLWAHRGDEEPQHGYLSAHMRLLLDQYRDQVVS